MKGTTIPTILVIGPDGTNLGQHTMEYAQRIADERFGMDLVEVRPNVYKILDSGKLAYEASKRKVVKAKPIKEMKFKLSIQENDFKMKINQIIKFLGSGSTVKITIWFSGREVSRPEAGVALMSRISANMIGHGDIHMNPNLEGKNMHMTVEPIKR